jgi:VanZ family protein
MKGTNPLRLAPLWWAAGVMLALFIVFESLTPSPPMPARLSDKLAHAASYGALSFWFAGIFEQRSYPALAGLLLALGMLVEVAQYLMGFGRAAEWGDVAANFMGITVALAIAYAGLGVWMLRIERGLGLS